MNAVTRLKRDGNVAIPQDVIDAAHLVPDADLEVEVRPDGVLLKPRSERNRISVAEALARLKAMKLYNGPPVPVEEISSVSPEWLRGHLRDC